MEPSLPPPPDADTAMIPATDVVSPFVEMAVAYWTAQCGAARFPARDSLTLRGMAAFLPHSVIAAVVDGGADYEYRYVGEAQRQAFGMYFKGLRLSRVEAEIPRLGALIRGAYEAVRASGVPFAVRGRVDNPAVDSRFRFHETAFLPLGASDAAVDHLLVVGAFVPTPFWEIPSSRKTELARTLRASLAGS